MTDTEIFSRMVQLRHGIRSEDAGRVFGATRQDRVRAGVHYARLREELRVLVDGMSVDQMASYADYCREVGVNP